MTWSNDDDPVAFIMTCFESLVMSHIKDCAPSPIDPLQLAYHPNWSTNHAITSALHVSLSHPPGQDGFLYKEAIHLAKPLTPSSCREWLWKTEQTKLWMPSRFERFGTPPGPSPWAQEYHRAPCWALCSAHFWPVIGLLSSALTTSSNLQMTPLLWVSSTITMNQLTRMRGQGFLVDVRATFSVLMWIKQNKW